MGVFDTNIDRSSVFGKATEGAAEEDKRHAEERLLKPKPVEPYQGELPEYKSEIESRVAIIVFNSMQQKELIGELFSIRKSQITHETYITDIGLLGYFAKQVRAGNMEVVNNQLRWTDGSKSEIDQPDQSDEPEEEQKPPVLEQPPTKGSVFKETKRRVL